MNDDRRMRLLTLFVAFFAVSCDRPPARIVAGAADTVVVNSDRPVKLPVRVLDTNGHLLSDTAVRYQWKSGTPISVSGKGVVACTQSVDAIVRASLGRIGTDVVVRCRPVLAVRATRMLNLIVGDSAQDLPFEALGLDEKPVTLLSAQVKIEDSSIVSVDGLRVRARAAGQSFLTMRVGNRFAFTSVHAYAPARTPEGIRPGQRVAVRVRLSGGEMIRWRLSPSPQGYFVAMLPDNDEELMPHLAILGAYCSQGLGPHSFFCNAQQGASVIVYHPREIDPRQALSGTLAVWRQDWIQ